MYTFIMAWIFLEFRHKYQLFLCKQSTIKQGKISEVIHIMPKSFHISKYLLFNATALLQIVF